jgi:hypothetical protein
MKKEDLVALGLTEEQITKIFEYNGKDITAEQKKTEKAELDRDNYKGQLETAQTTLKEFDGVDVKDMQSKITQLTTDLQNKESEYQTRLSDIDFNQSIETAIKGAGGKNAKAVKALLDIDALKSSKDQTADIKAAIEACQKDNGFLFGVDEPINTGVASTGGRAASGTDPNTAALRAAMGLKPAE